ncbi:LOW QUALITY PROTEIN: olfactory receptor 51F1 [Dugong dugon]
MKFLSNLTSQFRTFFLTIIPGLESVHTWLSFPFCCLCGALSGILFVIITQQSNQEPMYCFFFRLSATDPALTVSTTSVTLDVLLFDASQISLDTCIIQMFFLHGFTVMESEVLVAVGFDHYVPVPLRYTTILTNSRIIHMSLLMITSTVVSTILTFLLFKPSFCRANALSHLYYYHPDVIKLTCSDTQINSICGLIGLILTTRIDTLCVVLSYTVIIPSVLSSPSSEEWHKVFSTCVSHTGAVSIFYISMVILSLVHCYGSVPKVVQLMMVNVYLLLPPVFNPIIYSNKNKLIHNAKLNLLLTK